MLFVGRSQIDIREHNQSAENRTQRIFRIALLCVSPISSYITSKRRRFLCSNWLGKHRVTLRWMLEVCYIYNRWFAHCRAGWSFPAFLVHQTAAADEEWWNRFQPKYFTHTVCDGSGLTPSIFCWLNFPVGLTLVWHTSFKPEIKFAPKRKRRIHSLYFCSYYMCFFLNYYLTLNGRRLNINRSFILFMAFIQLL